MRRRLSNLRPQLARAGRGFRAAALAVGREIGPLEVAISATGYGAYLLALHFLEPKPAIGAGLVVGGVLWVVTRLILDALAGRFMDSGSRPR